MSDFDCQNGECVGVDKGKYKTLPKCKVDCKKSGKKSGWSFNRSTNRYNCRECSFCGYSSYHFNECYEEKKVRTRGKNKK